MDVSVAPQSKCRHRDSGKLPALSPGIILATQRAAGHSHKFLKIPARYRGNTRTALSTLLSRIMTTAPQGNGVRRDTPSFNPSHNHKMKRRKYNPAGSLCQVKRRWLVRHHTLNLVTGKTEPTGKEEWIEGPCGIPHFREPGSKCRSCEKGWTHPENYPV